MKALHDTLARGTMIVLVLGAAFCCKPDVGRAATRWSLGPTAGTLALDGDLANYRWDTRPAPAWGVSAAREGDRIAFGLQAWRAVTTQGTGIPGEAQEPHVRLSAVTLSAGARLVELFGTELRGRAALGRIHLGYDPDQLSLQLSGNTPVNVHYAPLNAWLVEMGFALRHFVTGGLALGLQVGADSFALDTLHRNGNDIEPQHERFINWMARLEFSWHWPTKRDHRSVSGGTP